MIIELARKYDVSEVQFKVIRNFGYAHFEEINLNESHRESLLASINRSLDAAIANGVRLTINDHELLSGLDLNKVDQAKTLTIKPPTLNFPLPKEQIRPEFEQQHLWYLTANKVLNMVRVAENKRCFKPFHYTYITR